MSYGKHLPGSLGKVLAIGSVLVVSLWSCSLFQDSDDRTNESDADSTPGEVVVASAPGLDALGYGYDVTSEYATPKGLKLRVLDMDALLANKRVYQREIEDSTCDSCSGSSFSQYTSSFNSKTNMSAEYSYYSGSIKANFSERSLESTSYSYATIFTDINKVQLYLSNMANIEDLRENIDSELESDLNPASDVEDNSDHLFRYYGTSVLTSIFLGARMEYSTSAKSISASGSTSTSIDAYAKAEFKSLFASSKLSVSTSTSLKSSFENSNTSINTIIRILGGSSEYIASLGSTSSSTEPTSADSNYQSWIQSVAEHSVFCNVGENGVLPIYELARTAARREYLKGKYEEYCQANAITITDGAYDCIVDIQVKTSDEGEILDFSGRKYYRINQDLNKGVSGSADIYLYVCYGKKDGTSYAGLVPISDFALVKGDSKSDAAGNAADGYEMYDLDLNKGAGSDTTYIYLCYKRSATESPITNIYVNDSTKGTHVFPDSYDSAGMQNLGYADVTWMQGKVKTSTRADLNSGAGGDDIFLLQSTTAWD